MYDPADRTVLRTSVSTVRNLNLLSPGVEFLELDLRDLALSDTGPYIRCHSAYQSPVEPRSRAFYILKLSSEMPNKD
jgi:hypothetical protein